MSLTIRKFPLPDNGSTSVEMPHGARVLSADVQSHEVCLWALIDTDAPMERRQFAVHDTGQPLAVDPASLHFIDTFMMRGGTYVGHVFEFREPK